MKLEEIEKLWAEDSKIDQLRLSEEAARTPQLHHKYYQILIRETLLLKKKAEEQKQLEKDKFLYYSGAMTDAELKARNWEQCDLKVLKPDMQRFIDADGDVIKMKLEYALLNEKVNYLKSILEVINNRSYLISNIINWEKFTHGVN